MAAADRLARAEACLDAIDHYAVKAEPEITWAVDFGLKN